MKKISTSPFFFKTLFPTFWFGFLAIFFVIGVSFGAYEQSIMFLIMPIIMIVFGFFLFKSFAWDLADEVLDNGNELLVTRNNQNTRIELKDIVNINHQKSSPERVVLTIRNKDIWGGEIAFIPPFRFNVLSKNKYVEDLIERVDKARNT